MACFLFCSSCISIHDGEALPPDLEPLNFDFKVTPDSRFVSVGDTVKIEAAIPARLSNGTVLTEGTVVVNSGITYFDTTAWYSWDQYFISAREHREYLLEIVNGDVVRNKGIPDLILGYKTSVRGDSLVFRYRYVLQKKGLYEFYLSASTANTSSGKAIGNSFFLVPDNHWDFVTGLEVPDSNSGNYKQCYFVGVR